MPDFSAPMQIKPAEVTNPADILQRVMTLKALGTQAQERQVELQQKQVELQKSQRDFNDQSLMRVAASNNTHIDPLTNTPSLDKAGYMRDIANGTDQTPGNAILSQAEGLRLDKMDLDRQKDNQAYSKGLVDRIRDQQSLDYARSEGQKRGNGPLPLPQNFNDPAFPQALQNLQLTMLDHEKRSTILHFQNQDAHAKAEQALNQQKFAQQKSEFAQELGVRKVGQEITKTGQEIQLKKLTQEQQHFELGQQMQAEQHFQTEISRSAPDDVKTALKDRYQADKFDKILAPYVNNPKYGKTLEERLDKVPLPLMQNAVAEQSKLSKGGVSSEGEITAQTPDTRIQKIQHFWQNQLSGKAQPGEAGSFLSLMRTYVHDLRDNAQDVATKHYKGSLDFWGPKMSPRTQEYAKKEGLQAYLRQGEAFKAEEEAAPGGAPAGPSGPGFKLPSLAGERAEAEGSIKAHPDYPGEQYFYGINEKGQKGWIRMNRKSK